MRVLIVDDAALERTLLTGILQQEGFEVIAEAVTGVQAVELHQQLRPDIAIIDLMLPQMSGIEVARAILALQPSAVLVAISGLSQPSVRAEARAAGIRAFVPKPIERGKLLAAINFAIRGH